MKTISLKVPDSLDEELKTRARSRGSSKSALIRMVLLREVAPSPMRRKNQSLLEKAADLVGSLEGGPRDLARNKEHLKGYGR